jgi:lysophospholipase L1-like esterase
MDILDEPITYPEEVAAFDLSTQRDKFRIVALGDSTTLCARQEKGARWPDLLEAACGPSSAVTNAGIGGTSSSLALFRWHRDVAPLQPHCVVINFVLNDSHIRHYECRSSYVVQCSFDRMDANLRALVDLSRGLGAAPIFWTPPPVPPWKWEAIFKSDTHLKIQQELLHTGASHVARVARELEVPIADLWNRFPELVDEFPGPYFDPPDGYHSNGHSQPIIADEIAGLVKELLPSAQGQAR